MNKTITAAGFSKSTRRVFEPGTKTVRANGKGAFVVYFAGRDGNGKAIYCTIPQ